METIAIKQTRHRFVQVSQVGAGVLDKPPYDAGVGWTYLPNTNGKEALDE